MIAALGASAGALGSPNPPWLTEQLVTAVQERMRQLMGHWRATPYGGSMVLEWRT
jgi:hypothetical protein